MAKKKIEKRKSTKRSIRWADVAQLDVIQQAADKLNENSEPGQRVTFNNLVADASYQAACKILQPTKKPRK